jgi:hypothetical protein
MTTTDDALKLVATLGITITPAEPPEAMVRLAREIADRAAGYCDPAEKHPCQKVALAALQHAADVVQGAEHEHAGHYAGLREGVLISRVTQAILTALGAGGRYERQCD